MYNTSTLSKCLQNSKVCCGQIKQQEKDGNSKGRVGKFNQFWKGLVRRAVYDFNRRKVSGGIGVKILEVVDWSQILNQPSQLE